MKTPVLILNKKDQEHLVSFTLWHGSDEHHAKRGTWRGSFEDIFNELRAYLTDTGAYATLLRSARPRLIALRDAMASSAADERAAAAALQHYANTGEDYERFMCSRRAAGLNADAAAWRAESLERIVKALNVALSSRAPVFHLVASGERQTRYAMRLHQCAVMRAKFTYPERVCVQLARRPFAVRSVASKRQSLRTLARISKRTENKD